MRCSSYRDFELSGLRVIGTSSYRDFELLGFYYIMQRCLITMQVYTNNVLTIDASEPQVSYLVRQNLL